MLYKEVRIGKMFVFSAEDRRSSCVNFNDILVLNATPNSEEEEESKECVRNVYSKYSQKICPRSTPRLS